MTDPARISTYHLNLSNFTQFLGAVAEYRIDYDATTPVGVPEGLPGHLVAAKSLHTGIFSGSTGNATTSLGVPVANTYPAPWSTTGGPGAIYYGYDTPVGTSFAESWLVAGVHNGRHTLEFAGGGSGFLVPLSGLPSPLTGILFRLVITIDGNWTSFGTGFGQLEWLGYTGAGYSVDNFFTYANNVTTFELSHQDWDAVSPNASFRLYGESVVPEPATIVLLATGFLGLGAMSRLRRLRS